MRVDILKDGFIEALIEFLKDNGQLTAAGALEKNFKRLQLYI